MSKELIGDLLQSITLYSAGLENPDKHMTRLSNAAHCIEELERERDSFYMDYRMKCDEETKALQADNARLREALCKCLFQMQEAAKGLARQVEFQKAAWAAEHEELVKVRKS